MKHQNIKLTISIIFTTFVALWLFPSLIKKATDKPFKYPFVYYGSIIKELCIVDFTEKKFPMQDLNGKKYSTEECDSLMPLLNYRQLLSKGEMPDSIDGVEITPQILRAKSVSYRFRPSQIGAPETGLHVMLESMPKRVGLEMPEDVFRIKNRIEFIEAKTNNINYEKNKLFEHELSKRGYKFPTKWAVGNPTTRKPYDEGYFCLDANNRLFHIKMVNGKPFVKDTNVSDSIDVEYFSMLESSDRRFYGFLFDKNGVCYILEGGEGKYTPSKLDIPALDLTKDQMTVIGNMLYWNVGVNKPGEKNYYALRSDNLERVAEYNVVEDSNNRKLVFDYLIPFYITFEAKNSAYIYPRFIFNSFKGLLVNIILALIVLFIISGKKNKKERYFNTILTLVTGITGLAAFLLLPDFRK